MSLPIKKFDMSKVHMNVNDASGNLITLIKKRETGISWLCKDIALLEYYKKKFPNEPFFNKPSK